MMEKVWRKSVEGEKNIGINLLGLCRGHKGDKQSPAPSPLSCPAFKLCYCVLIAENKGTIQSKFLYIMSSLESMVKL